MHSLRIRESIWCAVSFRTVGRAWGAPPSPQPWAAMAGVMSAVALATLVTSSALLFGGTRVDTLGTAGYPNPTSPDSPPILAVVNASTNPIWPREGDIVTVSMTIANHGATAADTATISLVDNRPGASPVPIGETQVSTPIPPGAFAVVNSQPFVAVGVGEHTLAIQITAVSPPGGTPVDGSMSIPMTVEPAPGASQPPPLAGRLGEEGLRTIGFAAILVVLVAATLLILVSVLSRPRDPGPLDPPAPEPPDRSPPPLWPP